MLTQSDGNASIVGGIDRTTRSLISRAAIQRIEGPTSELYFVQLKERRDGAKQNVRAGLSVARVGGETAHVFARHTVCWPVSGASCCQHRGYIERHDNMSASLVAVKSPANLLTVRK